MDRPLPGRCRCWICHETEIHCTRFDLLRNDTAWQGQAQSVFPALGRLEDRRRSRGIDGLCRLLIGIARVQLALLLTVSKLHQTGFHMYADLDMV